jgi:hypothetical protein
VQILFADLVEGADATAFNQRPKAFDGLRMDRTNNILLFGMVNYGVRIFLSKVFVAYPLVGTEQADLVRNCFMHEGFESGSADIPDNASNNVPLALDGADDRRLARSDATCSMAAASLILVSVFGEAADKRFVNLDNAAKLLDVLDQRSSDLVAHEPSGSVGAETEEPHDLKGANSLFAGQHQMRDAKPILEWLIRVLKDRSGKMGKTIARRSARRAFGALPVPLAGREIVDSGIAAARASNTLRPAPRNEIRLAGFLIGKHDVELGGGKLVDGLGLFRAGHDGSSLSVGGYCHV